MLEDCSVMSGWSCGEVIIHPDSELGCHKLGRLRPRPNPKGQVPGGHVPPHGLLQGDELVVHRLG
eukprot:4416203-Alexandrium_andersonii.AAC.1